ncbi:MAG: hypothetical protein F4X56_05495 [Gammaproteobacteria bacterium]|nr:hypothetical protein [Gammaproteobacteria bacterium]
MKRVPRNLVTLFVIGIFFGVGATLFVQFTINDRTSQTPVSTTGGSARTENLSSFDRRVNDSVQIENARELITSFEQTSALQHKFERNAALYALLSNLNEDQIQLLLSHSANASWGRDHHVHSEIQLVLLAFQAARSPNQALNFALQTTGPNRSSFITAVFSHWEESTFSEATAHANNLDRADKPSALRGLLASETTLTHTKSQEYGRELQLEPLATSIYLEIRCNDFTANQEEIWQEAVGLVEYADAHFETLVHVGLTWVSRNGFSVMKTVIESLPYVDWERDMIFSIVSQLTPITPAAAFEYVRNLDREYRNSLLELVIDAWVTTDPKAALNAVDTLESSPFRNQLQFTIVRAWTQISPQNLLTHQDSLDPAIRPNAVQLAIYAMVESAPEDAAEIVSSLEDEQARQSAAGLLVAYWSLQDVDAALNWIEGEPSLDSFRAQVLYEFVLHLSLTDPTRAVQVASQQPLTADGQAWEVELIYMLTERDLEAATELLPHVRAGQPKVQAHSVVAYTYLQHGEIAKALSLGQNLPTEDSTQFYDVLASVLAYDDPETLLREIENFPTGKARSKAALYLIQQQNRVASLTDEQIASLEDYLIEEDRKLLQKTED